MSAATCSLNVVDSCLLKLLFKIQELEEKGTNFKVMMRHLIHDADIDWKQLMIVEKQFRPGG